MITMRKEYFYWKVVHPSECHSQGVNIKNFSILKKSHCTHQGPVLCVTTKIVGCSAITLSTWVEVEVSLVLPGQRILMRVGST